MHLVTKNPSGQISFLNLSGVNILRLELACMPPKGGLRVGKGLAVGIRYVDSGTSSLVVAAGLDIPDVPDNDLTCYKIAQKGLPYDDGDRNRKSLNESMKSLFNVIDNSNTVDEYITKGVELVDVYDNLYKALKTGASVAGDYHGYKYVVTKEQYGWDWAA